MFVLGLIWSLVRSAPSPSQACPVPTHSLLCTILMMTMMLHTPVGPMCTITSPSDLCTMLMMTTMMAAIKSIQDFCENMFSASMSFVSNNRPSHRNLWYLQTSRIFVTSTRIFSSRWVSKTCTRNLPNRTISQELEKYETMPEDVGHCFVTWVISFSVNFTRFPFNCTP